MLLDLLAHSLDLSHDPISEILHVLSVHLIHSSSHSYPTSHELPAATPSLGYLPARQIMRSLLRMRWWRYSAHPWLLQRQTRPVAIASLDDIIKRHF